MQQALRDALIGLMAAMAQAQAQAQAEAIKIAQRTQGHQVTATEAANPVTRAPN
jgi:hypothetical protein